MTLRDLSDKQIRRSQSEWKKSFQALKRTMTRLHRTEEQIHQHGFNAGFKSGLSIQEVAPCQKTES